MPEHTIDESLKLLARRLHAAWLSSHLRHASVDYTLRRHIGEDSDPGEFWLALAQLARDHYQDAIASGLPKPKLAP